MFVFIETVCYGESGKNTSYIFSPMYMILWGVEIGYQTLQFELQRGKSEIFLSF